MKKLTFTAILFASVCAVFAQKAEPTHFGGSLCNGVEFEAKNGVRGQVIAYSPNIIRVVKYPGAAMPEKKSLSVIAEPSVTPKITVSGKSSATVSTGTVTAVVDLKTGAVRFSAAGKNLLKEKEVSFEERTSGADKGAYIVGQTFTLDKEEPIYGIGIYQDGKMSRRNSHYHMVQGNGDDYVNIIHSAKGYALFWDNYSPTDFTDNANGMEFKSEVGDLTDYYLIYGGNPDGTIAQIRKLTGEVPMAPLWAYGFMQSRERYKSTDELLEVFRKYRALKIPVDVMIQDWQYWGSNYTWNAMEFIAESFTDYKDMIKEVHDGGSKIMISIWSSFGPMTRQYREMEPKGMLLNIGTWPQSGISHIWPPVKEYPSGVKPYDVYNAEARDIYWRHLTRLADAGIDGWWMDSTEPDHLDIQDSDFEIPTAMGSFRKVRNAYPLLGVEGVYNNHRKYSDKKRVFILTRSAFAGQQRTGANVWSGDTGSSWSTLRNQVSAGLNFSLTGNPNYNHDLGGFFASAYGPRTGENCGMNNPLFRELYVRWLQQGIFLPMMRSHGESFPREFFYYGKEGEPVYDALVEAVRFRYKLIPYIYSLAHEVSANNGTFMRALMMDFPKDKNVYEIGDEYMFGPALLTAPILEAQYTTEKVIKVDAMSGWDHSNTDDKEKANYLNTDFTAEKSATVYLPKGAKWYDFWSNELIAGGKTITIPTHLNTIPLYVKAGSIVPIGPDVQYTTEKKWDNLEIRVYAGADGEFTLYEDEFDNYNYEKGAFTTIGFKWNDKAQKLTIGERKGSYDGMLTSRKFNVVIIKNGVAAPAKAVSYSGSAIEI